MTTPFRLALISLASFTLLSAPALRADEPAAPPPPPADKPEHPHRERNPGAMLDHLAKELNLTADQETKWKAIGQQEKTALDAIHDDASLAREDKRAKMMETNKTFRDQRRALLNPDQQKKFDELLAKMHEHGRRGGDHDQPPGDKPPGT